MADSTARQMRVWAGPAVLSFGFRPFFLVASVWAVLAMVIWLGMLAGHLNLPTAFGPVDWHAHTFIIGYFGAVLSGFLLTAVPNWTGRLPVVGWRLGALAAFWAMGRLVVMASALLPAVLVAGLDLLFLILLAIMLMREIVAGKNWRNLVVLAALLTLIAGGALFHWQAAQKGGAVHQSGFRLMLAAAVMMISLIGGRIIPSFTRNWLVRQGHAARRAPPMGALDRGGLLVTFGALILWVIWPLAPASGVALLAGGVAQAGRLGRWCGHLCLRAPLVWVLHLGFAFVPLGAVAMGLSILFPAISGPAAAQHLWMAGGIGLMTLAVMTRATLGHTGRDLQADGATLAIYLSVLVAVLMRVAAGAFPGATGMIWTLSGALWCAAFGGFALRYGPMLMRPRLPG